MTKLRSKVERARPTILNGAAKPPAELLKIDLGCGGGKQDGFLGADAIEFPGVDFVTDLRLRWPWKDESVAEARSAHFLEHLTNLDGKNERVHFFNELYRVLVPGGTCALILPHWCSNRYYGDPTHKEPFSEMGFYYLARDWRLGNKEKGIGANAPHTDASLVKGMYNCNFEATWGYGLHPQILLRNAESQQFAIQFYKEAAMDLHATLVKR